MDNNTIITLGREFGSGGREIGQKLAGVLDIPFYDRDLIKMAAEKSGFHTEVLEDADEKAGNIFLQTFTATSFAAHSRVSLPTELSINDRLFFVQAEVIKSLAAQGPCVIVGRCADYILRDHPSCVNIFIHARLEARIKRVSKLYSLSTGEAEQTILKTDKKRAAYYHYYSGKEWSHAASYDLTIDSSILGIDHTVEIARAFAEKKDREISPGI